MNYYVYYDPITTLITFWNAGSSTGANVLSITQAEYNQISANPTGWTVVNGVLTAPTTATILLANQQSCITQVKALATLAIYKGFSTTIAGQAVTITLDEHSGSHDQSNNTAAALLAQGILLRAGAWTANTAVAARTVVTVNGDYFITFAGGTTGTTTPTWPTAFSTPVTDNTVDWYKYGLRVSTTTGVILVGVADAITVFEQSMEFINNVRAQCQTYIANIQAATTAAAAQTIVTNATWPTS